MKIGVSAYSFNRYLKSGDMILAEVIRKAAELGFEGFEMLTWYFKDGKGGAAEAREVRKMLSDAGLELSSYTLGNNFGMPEGPERQAEIDRIRRELDVALVLGASVCRIESTFGPRDEDVTFEEMEDRVVRATKEVAEYALKFNLRLGVENHGRYMGKFDHILQLIKDVNSPAYGANPDIGNFMVVDDEPLEACRELAQYAVHVHAKDFRKLPPGPEKGKGWFLSDAGSRLQGVIVGEGDARVAECLQALRNQGYDGFLSIEHEASEDPIDGLKRSRDNLMQMIAGLK